MNMILRKTTIFIFCLSLMCLFSACRNEQSDPGSVLEIIDTGYRLSIQQIADICQQNDIAEDCIYDFKQHWTIYASAAKIANLKASLEQAYPSLWMKYYISPFYEFNRMKHCGESKLKEMDHILMTANLVADTLKQQAYMDYHRTQFEQWPEVSRGFCNAGFQRLLLFRNGRQLMLIISIPKGKSLDELNPKTTENNPRVNTWNQLMSAYQEGIEDAPKDVVWVMFKKVRP